MRDILGTSTRHLSDMIFSICYADEDASVMEREMMTHYVQFKLTDTNNDGQQTTMIQIVDVSANILCDR